MTNWAIVLWTKPQGDRFCADSDMAKSEMIRALVAQASRLPDVQKN